MFPSSRVTAPGVEDGRDKEDDGRGRGVKGRERG